MQESEFFRLVRKEERAVEYFERKIWRREWRKCAFCKATRPYSLKSGRYRCRNCRRDFHSWRGRWLGQLRIKASHWLWIVKAFESEWTPLFAVQKIGLSYPTLLRAYHVIRESILSPGLRDTYSHHPPRPHSSRQLRPIVINEKAGRVEISVAPTFPSLALANRSLAGCRKGSFVALENCRGNDWLIMHVDKENAKFEIRASKVEEGDRFRHFAISRLNKYHGVTRKYLAHYLSEVVFRYNHQDADLFELVAQAVSDPVAEA